MNFSAAVFSVAFLTVAASDARADIDEMTGKPIYTSSITSENRLHLKFPYGDVGGELVVRKHPRYGSSVFFMVEKGQIPCRSYSPCTVTVRFDEKPPQTFSGSNPDDGSSNYVFINGYDRFVSSLKTAKSVRIQATFYNNGNQILLFNTENMDLSSIIPQKKPKK